MQMSELEHPANWIEIVSQLGVFILKLTPFMYLKKYIPNLKITTLANNFFYKNSWTFWITINSIVNVNKFIFTQIGYVDTISSCDKKTIT